MYTKSYRHLTAEDRETVSLGLARGHSLRAIAQNLGRAPSPLSREMTRNTVCGHPYRAWMAQQHATARAHHPRRARKLLDPWLWQYVQRWLIAGCSPEQIAGRLRRLYPHNMRKRLSAETIYAGLYVLPRGALRTALLATLRQANRTRRPRARGVDRCGQIPNMTPLSERPAVVATRMVPGHCEGDLLKGARDGSAVGTLVERTTRLVLLAHMDGTDAVSVYRGFTTKLQHVPLRCEKHRPMIEAKKWRSMLGWATALDPGVLCRSAQPLATGDQ
ncbi:MAG: IS30 family transposase [Nitrospira sp.]|nr:IS30 family transposase [Nitrospira sp.]